MSDQEFIDNQAEIPETNLDATKEDQLAEESETTGVVSQREPSSPSLIQQTLASRWC